MRARVVATAVTAAAIVVGAAYHARHNRALNPPEETVESAPDPTSQGVGDPAPASRAAEDPLEVAWEQVHERPSDPKAWSRLGEAQAARNQLEAAKQSYRNAIRLGASDGLAYVRLGFILYAQQEDEEALALLMEARRRGAKAPLLDWTIGALQERVATKRSPQKSSDVAIAGRGANSTPEQREEPAPDVSSSNGAAFMPEPEPYEGPCEVPVERHRTGGALTLTVEVDGIEATLIVDTGATRSVLTEEFAARADIYTDHERILRARTANGQVELPTAVIAEIVVADRPVYDTRVAICNACEDWEADGLLGLDAQSQLGMQLDLLGQKIRFGDCLE